MSHSMSIGCLARVLSSTATPLLLVLVGLAAPGRTDAQATGVGAPLERSRFSGSVALLNTQPMGTLQTGPGVGVAMTGAWALDPLHLLRLRGEARIAGYGSERRRACLSTNVGCLIEVDVNTSYTALYLGVGPELALPLFRGAQLVLDATAGLGSFAVTSSVQGVSDSEDEDLVSTTNFEDDFFAWSVGGDLRIPVANQASITLGAHYQHNGEASYVPEGGITQNPDGSLAIAALTGDANLVAITLGVAFRPFVGWTKDDERDEELE